MKLNIDDVYEKATGQSLREQDKHLVRAFASKLLYEYATLIQETISYSDVDNHDFEDGKEAVAIEMIRYSNEIKCQA